MKLFARDNLCYIGNIIRKGDEIPADVPAHMLDHWREQGVLGEVPVVVESVAPPTGDEQAEPAQVEESIADYVAPESVAPPTKKKGK